MKKTIILLFFVIASIIFATVQIAENPNRKELPDCFNWQNIEGIDYTTPIKDQSPAPTCEAYALCAALETKMQYQLQELYEPDLSEAHLYFYPGGTYEAGYVNLVDAANYLIDYGVPDEGCYPDPHRPFDYPFESLIGWENRTIKIQEWDWVNVEDDDIKQALIDHGPLIVCVNFHKDFFYYKGGIYNHIWGRMAGGHVMTLVGYDDNEQCWIIKNSWGTNWGDEGWLKIPYDEIIFADWYGPGTGVMYIEGLIGNFQPDVPKIDFLTPKIYNTYLFGRELRQIFRNTPLQEASPRILGSLKVEVEAENTNYIEFYIDDELKYTDFEKPFSWELETNRGLHTLKIHAYNSNNDSIDIIDIYKI